MDNQHKEDTVENNSVFKFNEDDKEESTLLKIKNKVLDFIFPENISCIICDKPIHKTNTYSLCKSCFDELQFILDGCIKCGKPIINHSLEIESIEGCSYCITKSFYFDKAISCIEYNDVSKNLILGLKYKNKTYMCKYISRIMKEKLELETFDFDYILFVPLHKKREKKRGFNQSKKLAFYLSKELNIPVVDCIYRSVNTRRLYNLNKEERKQELRDVFKANKNIELINRKNILLIDDIFTTGTTVNEVSKVLKFYGASNVYVMTLLTKVSDNYIAEDYVK